MSQEPHNIWPKLARTSALRCALMLVASACVAVLEMLHGHECTGEGCALCLTIAGAKGLLLFCTGITVARPIMGILLRVRFVYTRLPRLRARHKLPVAGSLCQHPSLTPLSSGVLLRI